MKNPKLHTTKEWNELFNDIEYYSNECNIEVDFKDLKSSTWTEAIDLLETLEETFKLIKY